VLLPRLYLQHSPNVSKLLLHTTESSHAKVEGFAALMAVLKNNVSLTDLTLSKDPKVSFKGVRVHSCCFIVGVTPSKHWASSIGMICARTEGNGCACAWAA